MVMHSVTRATTVARLMYAVPSWWGLTAEKGRAKIERLYNGLKRTGYLPVDAPPWHPGFVDQAEASLFQSLHQNPGNVLHQQYTMRTASAL